MLVRGTESGFSFDPGRRTLCNEFCSRNSLAHFILFDCIAFPLTPHPPFAAKRALANMANIDKIAKSVKNLARLAY